MINIIKNGFEGLYASPINHPVTCANPAPWLITEIKLEANAWVMHELKTMHKIWIRGEDSMWFRADQCYIGIKEELEEVQKYKLQCAN